MALTVYPAEGYDSFISLAEADAYLAAVGVADWASRPDPVREAALRRGTQYITGKQLTQYALSDTAAVPPVARVHPNVAAATAEAAVRAARGVLYKDVAAGGSAIEKTVGPLTLKYAVPKGDGQAKFPVIEDLLYGLVYAGPGGGPVVFERI